MGDRMREEEEKRKKLDEQRLERMEEEKQKEKNEEARQKAEEEAKRSRIPPEPPVGEPGRVDFMLRLPDGKRMRRAFRGTDTMGMVYDFTDIEGGEAVKALPRYRLVTTMPRQAYDD